MKAAVTNAIRRNTFPSGLCVAAQWAHERQATRCSDFRLKQSSRFVFSQSFSLAQRRGKYVPLRRNGGPPVWRSGRRSSGTRQPSTTRVPSAWVCAWSPTRPPRRSSRRSSSTSSGSYLKLKMDWGRVRIWGPPDKIVLHGGDSFTHAALLKHTRLCHAITYASCQGLTLEGRSSCATSLSGASTSAQAATKRDRRPRRL